jgi:hypothetical protein
MDSYQPEQAGFIPSARPVFRLRDSMREGSTGGRETREKEEAGRAPAVLG